MSNTVPSEDVQGLGDLSDLLVLISLGGGVGVFVGSHVHLLCPFALILAFSFTRSAADWRDRKRVRVLQEQAIPDGGILEALVAAYEHHPGLLGRKTGAFQEAVTEGFTTVHGFDIHVDMCQLSMQQVEAVDIRPHGLPALSSYRLPTTQVVVLAVHDVLI